MAEINKPRPNWRIVAEERGHQINDLQRENLEIREAVRRVRSLIRGDRLEQALVFPNEPNLGLGDYLDRFLRCVTKINQTPSSVNLIQEFQQYVENQEWMDPYNPMETVGTDHTCDLLARILGNAIKGAGIRGAWSIEAARAAGRMVEATLASAESKLRLGIYNWQVWLRVDLMPPEHIRDMGDDFWAEVVALQKHGQASLQENIGIDGRGTSADKALSKKNKSLAFSLARDCIFIEQEHEASGHMVDLTDAYMDFGGLELVWPIDTPAERMEESIREGVRHFYRIAYLLYRAGYLAEHARSRRKTTQKQ